MPGMPMGATPPAWTLYHAGAVLVAWIAMMVAMMLPTAAPAIMRRGPVFALGYATAWAGFGIAATALQWVLERTGALSIHMSLTSAALAAAVVLAAGIYQLTPLKAACLQHCRTESDADTAAIMTVAGTSTAGARIVAALAHGLRHGAHCIGCCWALMLLLFVGGAMNLVWMAALTLYLLLEKSLRRFPTARTTGLALIVAGTLAALRA
ncbi:MAG: DUF2182 domain-containing protein [Candidatus Eremiobacteraeota bacterium]|nr:DUF2182 domain-containing protein [Candidatus Eremiobacteraeota bacterium]